MSNEGLHVGFKIVTRLKVVETRVSKRDNSFVRNARPWRFTHSPVVGAFTIMWMLSSEGRVEKIRKSLCVDSNLSANVERPPRDAIRSARVLSGTAAIGLESLG